MVYVLITASIILAMGGTGMIMYVVGMSKGFSDCYKILKETGKLKEE